MANCLSDASVKVSMTDVYETTTKLPELLKSLGYAIIGYPWSPWFLIPLAGETYLTPELKIATKETGDRGPYGPRLILESVLTESEKTYGVGIKTGDDALLGVTYITAKAERLSGGLGVASIMTGIRVKDLWKVVDFRRLTSEDRCCYISSDFAIQALADELDVALMDYEVGNGPVYIVEKLTESVEEPSNSDYETVTLFLQWLYA